MTNSDIEKQIREVNNFEVSNRNISRIADSVYSNTIAWKNRPLQVVYLIALMESLATKVRENSKNNHQNHLFSSWPEQRRQKRSTRNVAGKG